MASRMTALRASSAVSSHLSLDFVSPVATSAVERSPSSGSCVKVGALGCGAAACAGSRGAAAACFAAFIFSRICFILSC